MAALPKQTYQLTFCKGLDTKSDPFLVNPGNFLVLENTIFTKTGLLQKRNGFAQLTSLPSTKYKFLTTYAGSLVALGSGLPLAQYTAGNATWVPKATFEPCQVAVQSIYRSGTTQTYADSAESSTGLRCVALQDVNGASTSYRYLVCDAATGAISSQAPISTSFGACSAPPKVFLVGHNFFIVFCATQTGSTHIQYIAISALNGQVVQTATDMVTDITVNIFAGVVTNNALYLAWPYASGVQMKYINAGQVQSSPVSITTSVVPSCITMTADTASSTPVIWCAVYDTTTTMSGMVFAETPILTPVLGVTSWTATSLAVKNITCVADNQVCTIFYEVAVANFNNYVAVTTVAQDGTVGSATTVALGIGLASHAALVNGNIYFLIAYSSLYQPTYYLWSYSIMQGPVAKVAYSNGGGYYTSGYLPELNVSGTQLSTMYLYKDLIVPVNKKTPTPPGQIAGVYQQTGINLAIFDLTPTGLNTAEIAGTLHLSSGFLWGYDGYNLVEHNFFYWPDAVTAAWSATGGHMLAQPDAATNTNAYFYQWTYEWADNQGQVHRSAPSIPVSVTTTGSGNTGSVAFTISTARLTYKTNTPIKIVGYRWSVAQEGYYQITSLTSPLLNVTNANTVSFVDTLADTSIIGNSPIYTQGGTVENIGPPACTGITLFDDRLWLIDAEDPNLLWFSKQVIETTPVEMSDLFTFYVAPSTGATGSTGIMTALSVMDAYLVIFKSDSISYVLGTGPDNTGAGNQYSPPQFITSTVGTINQNSIVFIPQGLIFQSDKGLWLLARNLQTSYIGWPVEGFNGANVLSATAISGTNQVRFVMDSGLMIVYDYTDFIQQWNTFTGITAISATLFDGHHTCINQYGETYQESPGTWTDGTIPTSQKFTTGWYSLESLQGFIKAYYFTLLGSFKSPHKLQIQIAVDYNPSPIQTVIFDPMNPGSSFGSDTLFGGSSVYGTTSSLEAFKFFFEQKKMRAFQLTIQELYDASQGLPPGAGLSISGIKFVYGGKKQYAPFPARYQTG